jgi:hypothetical protein
VEHHYKTWSKFFDKVGPEDKTFEIRQKRPDQPSVLVGDVLVLDETKDGTKELTGRVKRGDVGFVMNLSEMPGLMACQGAENRSNIADFEVYGLHNIVLENH